MFLRVTCNTKDEELYIFVSTIYAAASCTAEIERSFSELKFIVSDLRNQLGPELVQVLMLLRLNWHIYMAYVRTSCSKNCLKFR